MTKRRNADLFEVLIGQIRQDDKIDVILGKALRVLTETELFEPIRNLLPNGHGVEACGCSGGLATLPLANGLFSTKYPLYRRALGDINLPQPTLAPLPSRFHGENQ